MSDNNKCNINQRLIYIIVALSSVFLTLFFWNLIYLGPLEKSFVAKVEFAATLSSIILSVVAIVFTFIQSKQSESTTTKVIDASELIKSHSETLDTSVTKIEGEVNSLKDMNIESVLKKHLDKFDRKLERLDKFENQLDSIKELTCDKFDNVSDLMTSKFDSMFNLKSSSSKDKVNTEQRKQHLKYFVEYLLEGNDMVNYMNYAMLKFSLTSNENKFDLGSKVIASLSEDIYERKIFYGFNFNDITSVVAMLFFSLNLLVSIGVISIDSSFECTIDISDTINNFESTNAEEKVFKKLSTTLDEIFDELELNI